MSFRVDLSKWDEEDFPSFKEFKYAMESSYCEALMNLTRGNVARAARIAKKDRKDFYDVLFRNAISPNKYRELKVGNSGS